MEETLRILISAYEEEKRTLESSIKQYLEEEEYILASYHRNAAHRVNRHLQILKSIDNPFAGKIKNLKAGLNQLENGLGHGDVFYPREKMEESIRQIKELISQLEEKAKYSKLNIVDNIFDKAFDELFRRKIRYFKIHLNREAGFHFKISYSNKLLSLTFPNIRDLEKNQKLHYGQKGKLIAKGFILSKSGNRLSLVIPGDKNQIITKFNMLFSRIIFEVFISQNFEDRSAIEFGPSI
jgi:hypothetical protein